jgi:hypothetical protein
MDGINIRAEIEGLLPDDAGREHPADGYRPGKGTDGPPQRFI